MNYVCILSSCICHSILSFHLCVKSTYPHVQLHIGGDFNCPGVDWSDGSLINSYTPAPFRERLIEIADDSHLDQIVKVPH